MGRGSGRGKGKGTSRGRGRAKNKGKDKAKEKGQQLTLSSSRDQSSSPEPTPEPEEHDESNDRRNLRWLHAGVYEDSRANAHDIWYAFKRSEKYGKDGYKIVYARDAEGHMLGNYDVGQIKRNLITFDKHHLRKWREFLDGTGTWYNGKATKGRARQRETLLETWLDLSFIDPYPDGRGTKIICPRLNVIHDITGHNPDHPARASGHPNPPTPPLTPNQCYPRSNIPLSAAEIKIDDYKNIDEDSFKVISDFLTGCLKQQRNLAVQVDRIESAFFDQGWRVHRGAIEEALDDMHQDPGTTAFDSDAFLQDPPIRVDKFKGDRVERLIERLKGSHAGSDLENDSDGDNSEDDHDDHDNDDSQLFVERSSKPKPKQPGVNKSVMRVMNDLRKITAARNSSSSARNSHEEDSDSFEYVSDDSPLKGKAPASRKRVAEVQHELQEEVHNGVQDEVQNEVQDNGLLDINEDRSTPAPPSQVKPESPVIRNRWENAIIIIDEDSDVEFLEERIRPTSPKTEPSDGIVDMTMDDN